MKAKVIATGDIVEVHYWYQNSDTNEHIYRESSDLRGDRSWSDNELDFIGLTKSIDWEQRRFELVKAAMQGSLNAMSADFTIRIKPSVVAEAAIKYADAVIEKLKDENV